tara:strand:- start:7 stop:345 length:339 start_codon:yes stop_codon:yes gene_type:complete
MENLMKKRWVLYLIIIFSILLNSCKEFNNQSKSLNDDFVNVYKELEILKAKSQLDNISDSIFEKEIEQIFLKNNITVKDYKEELDYYLNNLSEFENVIKEALRRQEKSMNIK